MNINVSYHIKSEPLSRTRIEYQTWGNPGDKYYPVMHIGFDVTIYPSREQLIQMRDAISTFLGDPIPEPVPAAPANTSTVAVGSANEKGSL